jgi:Flp pilus assembly pilin Flp
MLYAIRLRAAALAVRARAAREDGQALVEYSLILALVATALLGTLALVAGGIEGVFETVINAL